MNRLSLRVVGLCLAVVGIAVPTSAQTISKVELSGGYQFMNFSVDGEGESMPVGWYFDVAGNLTPMLGVVFQMGGNYKSIDESVTVGGISVTAEADVRVHEFLGGVRLSLRSDSPIVPFAQVLVGAINGSVEVSASTTIPGIPPIDFNEEDSATNFALEVGGGANFSLTDAVGLRVGADYLRAFEEDAGANLFRFHVGIVIVR
jgi:opacity protein-like surface antigen